MDINSLISKVFELEGYRCNSECVRKCILAISKEHNIAERDVVTAIMGSKTKIDIPLFQPLLSEFLFPLFDKYHTSQKTKKEYSDNKDEYKYYDRILSYFNIDLSKYSSFLDVCCNPGAFTLFVLKNNTSITGIGISLPPSKGGYKELQELENFRTRFTVNYADIFDYIPKSPDIIPSSPDEGYEISKHFDKPEDKRYDFAYSGCFINHNRGKEFRIKEFYAKTYATVMDKLETGGDYLNLLSFKWDYVLLLDTIYVLSFSFKNIKIYKDPYFTAGLSNVYVYCKGYLGNYDYDLLFDKYINDVNIYTLPILESYKKEIEHIFEIMNKKHISLIK